MHLKCDALVQMHFFRGRCGFAFVHPVFAKLSECVFFAQKEEDADEDADEDVDEVADDETDEEADKGVETDADQDAETEDASQIADELVKEFDEEEQDKKTVLKREAKTVGKVKQAADLARAKAEKQEMAAKHLETLAQHMHSTATTVA